MTNLEIHQAYLNTSFKVLFNQDVTIKINTFIQEIQYLHSWAFITAWNPYPEVLTLEENRKRNKNLELDSIKNNLVFSQGIGISEDGLWCEESLFIENISFEKANEWASKYKQKAFVFGLKNENAKLIYTIF
jgi:Protein of unknown function (DUF3293)